MLTVAYAETAEVKKLEVENATLKVQVEKAKKKLRDAEVANGKGEVAPS